MRNHYLIMGFEPTAAGAIEISSIPCKIVKARNHVQAMRKTKSGGSGFELAVKISKNQAKAFSAYLKCRIPEKCKECRAVKQQCIAAVKLINNVSERSLT